MRREVVLDTETTGMELREGHRIVEIGCVELVDRSITGETFHTYVNPERDVSAGAQEVHNITAEQLEQAPRFVEIVDEFLDFLGDSDIVAHNAEFDIPFINAELKRAKKKRLSADRVIDTLKQARRKFPNQSNSLDALCERFNVDVSRRKVHGALLDAQLLAQVYIDLTGARHESLSLEPTLQQVAGDATVLQRPEPLPPRLTDEERRRHQQDVIEKLGPEAIWHQYDKVAA